MGWEFYDVIRFDLRPILQGQMRVAKGKSAGLLLVLEVYNVKRIYRKSYCQYFF